MAPMRELWLNTWRLAGGYPVLWLPYVCAELISVCVWRVRGVAEQAILHHFMVVTSVLGGTVGTHPDPGAFSKASLAYLPVGFVAVMSVVFIFVIAFVVTAKIVEEALRGNSRRLGGTLSEAIRPWDRILVFGFKLLILCTGFMLPIAFLIVLYAPREYDAYSTSLRTILVAFMSTCVAWTVLPSAVKIVRDSDTASISKEARNFAALVAGAASISGVLLAVFASRLERGISYTAQWQGATVSALNSILANAPDVVLFIAVGVIAYRRPDPLEVNPLLEQDQPV